MKDKRLRTELELSKQNQDLSEYNQINSSLPTVRPTQKADAVQNPSKSIRYTKADAKLSSDHSPVKSATSTLISSPALLSNDDNSINEGSSKLFREAYSQTKPNYLNLGAVSKSLGISKERFLLSKSSVEAKQAQQPQIQSQISSQSQVFLKTRSIVKSNPAAGSTFA